MEKEEFAMWTRAELKQNAKDVLRNNYWMAFAVSLVYSLITGIVSSGSSFVNNSSSGSAPGTGAGLEISPEMLGALLLIALLGSLIGLVIGFVLSFFVFGPMQVGMVRYYMESRNGASSFGQLFYGFKRNYMNTATAMFLTNLFVSLWSLLLAIAVIIVFSLPTWAVVAAIPAVTARGEKFTAQGVRDALVTYLKTIFGERITELRQMRAESSAPVRRNPRSSRPKACTETPALS